MAKLAGGCLCGAVRYEISDEPLFSGLCHCRDCQRSSASAFIPYLGVARASITITGKTRSYTRPSEDGSPATRNFCPVCATTVFGGDRDDDSGVLTLYAGTLDDPAVFTPREHIFTRSRMIWSHIAPDTLPEHQRLPEQD